MENLEANDLVTRGSHVQVPEGRDHRPLRPRNAGFIRQGAAGTAVLPDESAVPMHRFMASTAGKQPVTPLGHDQEHAEQGEPLPMSQFTENLLVLAATEADGSLAKPALETLGAAVALRASLGEATLSVGLIGASVQAAAEQTATALPARILGVTGVDFAMSRYASDAAAAEALCRSAQPTVVLAPGTSRLLRCLPGVAQRLDGRADTHITALSVRDGKPHVQRWYYRQRMEGLLTRTHRPWFILVDPGSQTAWTGAPGAAVVESVIVPLSDSARRTTVTGFREPAADAQTIRPDADLLFVAGAGWTKKQADGQTHVAEAEKLILGSLNLTQASLGSSKSLVDLGGEGQAVLRFLSHLNQVGQTGATPRHPKGLATCCHGEEPHTVGWRFVNERRAINLDPNCGWARGKADVLYVADAFAVLRALNAKGVSPTL
jgi:electron transfer flavoprotein alpha subunit